ncbi:hypothetical protein BH11MYX2_BH11MYX2_25700 [soil metagenome]
MKATDTSAIQRLIGQARFRLRGQGALETACTALILADALALAAVFGMRIEWVSRATGIGMLIGAIGVVVIGALVGAIRTLTDETIARRIDRASGLSDRLSTAIAFNNALEAGKTIDVGANDEDETRALMHAAIKDGLRAVPKANVAAASPFRKPRDLWAAFVFTAVCALAAGIGIPVPDRQPALTGMSPDHGRPGDTVKLVGRNLSPGPVGVETSVSFETDKGPRTMAVLSWTGTDIQIRVPNDAPFGPTKITAMIGTRTLGPVDFLIVDPKDTRYHDENSVLLDADERAYVESILNQLRAQHVPELDKFADDIEKMLKEAEDGKVTKEQLLDALAKAEKALSEHMEPNQAEIDKQMSEMGKSLQDNALTKELGKALEQHDLKKAQEEFEKLGDKLDPDTQKKLEELEKKLEDQSMSEAQKNDLKKQLEDLKKQLENKNLSEKEKKDLEKKIADLEKQLDNKDLTPEQKAEMQKKIDDLQKQLQQQNLTPEQKQELQKKLDETKKDMQNPQLSDEQRKDLEKKRDEAKDKLANKDLTPEQKKQLEDKMKDLQKQLENKNLTPEQKKDLEKQIEQMQDQKPMTEQEKQQLQQKLEQVSKQMQQKQDEQKKQQSQQQQKMEDEIKRLEKKKQEAKNDKEQQETERQLQKKKDELQQLKKDEDSKEQSAQREALKRLQKDVEKAAESLDKKDQQKQNKDERDEEEKERDRQASQKMKDAARETGAVDKDQRKQAAQKKMASQMDDLREALRRAKQKGNKGPNDPFNKNGKNQDFAQRSRGQKGQGSQWKPGQGQQGQGQQGQQGQGQQGQQQGNEPGTEHDENLTGDPTQKSGHNKDQDLQGTQGKNGSSRRETILSAAQKGFASTSYEKVYADYQKIVEEVMRNEKLPSSYKYYVKRYFAKIHPSGSTETP